MQHAAQAARAAGAAFLRSILFKRERERQKELEVKRKKYVKGALETLALLVTRISAASFYPNSTVLQALYCSTFQPSTMYTVPSVNMIKKIGSVFLVEDAFS